MDENKMADLKGKVVKEKERVREREKERAK